MTSPYQDKKILVTGATGFLGTHLCRRLLEGGGETFAVSRTSRNSDSKRLHWLQGDPADSACVRHIFGTVKPDIIFHLSGLASADTSFELVLPTYQSLLTSTVCMLTQAAEVGCSRFVIPGSLTEPLPESLEIVPGSPYAAAKWASSVYGRMFYKVYQTPVVIVRPFMTYGPGQSRRKLIPSVALSAFQGEAPEVASGQWEADWIYVDDVVAGIMKAGYTPGIEGMTIDLGSGLLTSVRAIVEMTIALTGRDVKPIFGGRRDRPFEQVRIADTDQAYAALGWKPMVALADGLERTVTMLRQQVKADNSG